MRVSIIGTSGRSADPRSPELNLELYFKMFSRAEQLLNTLPEKQIQLISGGAAWADHLAVSLFLTGRYGGLKLYCPAPFENGQFKDTGVVDWIRNPGGTLNYYHRLFSQKVGVSTLSQIGEAVSRGAVIDFSCSSFHQRNGEVAKSEIVLAFTWGKDEPKSGGTGDTWKKIPTTSSKFHVSLDSI